MQRIVIIVRFGSPAPLRKEMDIMAEVANINSELAIWNSLSVLGIVSAVYTDWTVERICNKFKEVEEETEDILPVIIFELDDPNTGFNLHEEGFMEGLEWMKSQISGPPEINKMELDDLLDLINKKGGVDMLTAEELARLQKLSQK